MHDRFHLERYLSRAVDLVRREEYKRAQREGCDESLRGKCWLWLRKLATLNTVLDEERLRAFAALRQQVRVVGRAGNGRRTFGAFLAQP